MYKKNPNDDEMLKELILKWIDCIYSKINMKIPKKYLPDKSLNKTKKFYQTFKQTF